MIKTNFEFVETRVDLNVVQTVLVHRDSRLCNRPVQLIVYGFTVNTYNMEMQYTFTRFSNKLYFFASVILLMFLFETLCFVKCFRVLENPPIESGRTESINGKYRFLNKCNFTVVSPHPRSLGR